MIIPKPMYRKLMYVCVCEVSSCPFHLLQKLAEVKSFAISVPDG